MLGLNTCWVGLTYKKRKLDVQIKDDEKLVCVLALGYGSDQGTAHKSKDMGDLCVCPGEMPEWFRNGMESAMLAPTAMNQQKFRFTLNDDGSVRAQGAVRNGRPRHSQAALRDRRRKGKLQVGVSPVPPRAMRGGFLTVQ